MPWLAKGNPYIGCRIGDMAITNSPSKKKLTLYPPTKPLMDIEETIWAEEEDNGDQIIQPILTIDMYLGLIPHKEEIVISYFLQNLYSSPFLLGDIVIMEEWEILES